ncbi:MAG TPA: tetratricopeptide repeat protein [Bdellovibrionota bacterium]|nr:tetratricopeptide repeat protein [Bdellovibrionota bacterium]
MIRRYSLFLILAVAAFGPLLFSPYHYDDSIVIQTNELLRSFAGIKELWLGHIDHAHEMDGTYRPLFLTGLALIGRIFDFSPIVFHFASIALHALNALLLYVLATRLIHLSPRMAFVTSSLFLLHPVQVTSLAIIWKQSDLWVASAALGTLFLLFQFSRSQKKRWLICAGLLFLGSFLIKESPMILPLLWLAAEPIFPKAGRKSRFVFVALGCAVSFLYYKELCPRVPRPYDSEPNPSTHLQYFSTQLSVFPYYLRDLFWPDALTVDRTIYVPAALTATGAFWMAAAALMVGLLILLAVGRRSRTAVAFLWGMLWLAPTSSFEPLSILYDETRLYLTVASVSLALMIAVSRYRHRVVLSKNILRLAMAAPIVLLGMLSFCETARWKSDRRLWEATLDVDPTSARAHYMLGYLDDMDRAYDDAEQHYRKALELSSDFPNPRLNLGILLGRKGDLDGAAAEFTRLLSAPPHWAARGHYHLALDFLYRGKPQEGLLHLEKAKRLDPTGVLAAKGEKIFSSYLARPKRVR